MDLTAAIMKIVELAKPQTYEIDNRTLSSSVLVNLPLPTEPRYPTIELRTLNGLVEFIADCEEAADAENDALITVGATEVQYVSGEMGVRRERDTYAHVKIAPPPFTFGQWTELETFRVQLLTRFVEGPHRAAILNFISKINDEAIKTLTDSGITQTLQAKVGIASFGSVEVPSPVDLAPIRTFAEIEQPEGAFIFRMRKAPGTGAPEAALFEIYTDWQRIAVERIYAHLKSFAELKDVPIYA